MESVPRSHKDGKNKLFMCFKSDDSSKHTRKHRKVKPTPDPVLAYLSSANEDGVVLSSQTKDAGEECGSGRRRHRQNKRRDTWQAIRTAVIETSLMKKILSRWRTKKESMSKSNRNSKIAEANSKRKPTSQTNSNASSSFGDSSTIFTSSSSLSSTSSSRTDNGSGSSSYETSSPSSSGTGWGVSKQNSGGESRRRKGNCGSNKALFMLLIISLLVLILWGKFVAILCTLSWFYLVPLSRRRLSNEGVSSCGESEFDSVQYKKKIIMEGLLERSHSRVLLASMSKS